MARAAQATGRLLLAVALGGCATATWRDPQPATPDTLQRLRSAPVQLVAATPARLTLEPSDRGASVSESLAVTVVLGLLWPPFFLIGGAVSLAGLAPSGVELPADGDPARDVASRLAALVAPDAAWSADILSAPDTDVSRLADVASGLVLALQTTRIVCQRGEPGVWQSLHGVELQVEVRAVLWDVDTRNLLWCSRPASSSRTVDTREWIFTRYVSDWSREELMLYLQLVDEMVPALTAQLAADLLGQPTPVEPSGALQRPHPYTPPATAPATSAP